MPTSLLESAMIADGALAVFSPDPNTGTVVDRTGNYTATLRNGAAVTSDVLVNRSPGAISLDGTNDYVSTDFGTRRNLCTNPRAAVGTTDWTNSGGVSLTRNASPASGLPSGVTESFNFVGNSDTDRAQISVAVTSGTTYTFSVYVRLNSLSATSLKLWWANAAGTGKASTTITTVGGNFVRYSVTVAADATETWTCRVQQTGVGAMDVDFSGVLVEASSSVNAYFDGSGYVNGSGTWVPATDVFRTDLGDTAWTGTAHASTSTRAGRTNLCTNPRASVNTTGWTNGGVTLTRNATPAGAGAGLPVGVTETFNFTGAANAAFALCSVPVVSGTTYTFTMFVRLNSLSASDVSLNWHNAANSTKASSTFYRVVGGNYARLSVTVTADATETWTARIRQEGAGAVDLDFSAVLIEASAAVNGYFDGSGSVEHRGLTGWLGLEHASASDCGVFANGTTRTFVALANRDANTSIDAIAGGAQGGQMGFLNGVDYLFANFGTFVTLPTATLAAGTAGLVALGLDGSSYSARVNGGSRIATAHTQQYAAGLTLEIGATSGAGNPFDGLIGPVAIFDRALSATTHRAYADLFTYGTPQARVLREPIPALQVTATAADGSKTRWAADESDGSRVPTNLVWATSMPGGADTLTCRLPRDPERGYSDLGLLTDLSVSRDGGRTQRYRLEETPSASGDDMAVEPAARGYRAALEDRQDVRVLYVDRDLSRWTGMSAALRIANLTGGLDIHDFTTAVDTESGLPALIQTLTGPWSSGRSQVSWVTYDPGEGVRVAKVYYDFVGKNNTADSNFQWIVRASDRDDHGGTNYDTADLQAASGSGYFTPTAALRFANLQHYFNGAGGAGASGVNYAVLWRKLAVFGDHGLTIQGTAPGGFYTGAMIGHLVRNFAGGLPIGTVDDGTFLHTHAAYLDPGTTLSVLENLVRVEPLYDWYTYDGTFEFRRRGTYGKRWRARVADAALQSTGRSIARVFNEIAVRVDDPQYGTVIVGPPNSGYDTTSSLLSTADADNPAVAAGITRRYLLYVGEGTTDGAIAVGAYFLSEANRLDLSGQAQLVGFVEDDAGTIWPVDEVRAGDEIQFRDAADTSWRRITGTSYNHDSRANSITLDSPAETLEALLARLQAVLVPLN